MNMKKDFAILFASFLFLTPCLQAQSIAWNGVTTEDTTGAPPDYVKVDEMPQLILSGNAVYPVEAEKAGIEGKVFVKIWVDKEGNSKKAIIVNSTDDIFDKPSLDAAMKSRFSPAIFRGKPVDVWVVIPFTYKIRVSGETSADTLLDASQKLSEVINHLVSYATLLGKRTVDSTSYNAAMEEYRKATKDYEDYKVQAELYSQYAKEMLRQAALYLEQTKEIGKKQK